MRNFTYEGVAVIGMCTALPKDKKNMGGGYPPIALVEQTTADLGFLAAHKIIESRKVNLDDLGVLIFLTKTPDYRGPATAMVLQNRLQIPIDCIVYDAPTGNGGFENALNLGMSLLSTTIKKQALVIFGDTVSKQMSSEDLEVLNLQDGATAVLLEKVDSVHKPAFSTMTLSQHWSAFIVPSGGFRNNASVFESLKAKRPQQLKEHLHLDASTIFAAIMPELKTIKSKIVELIDREHHSNIVILLNLLDAKLENEFALLLQSEVEKEQVYLSTHGIQSMASTNPLMIAKVFREKELSSAQIISVSIGEGLSVNLASMTMKADSILDSIYSDDYYENGFVTHEM